MFDVVTGWNRLMESGFSMTQTGLRALETLGAANEVITARARIIGTALCSPHSGDHAELARIVPEKADAFSRAGTVTFAAWWTAHAAWSEQMQYFGMMSMRGRTSTASELADLGVRMGTLAVESVEAQARLGAAVLAPVHRKATSNARRLRRRKRG